MRISDWSQTCALPISIDQSRRRPARQTHGDGCGVRLAPLRARTQHLADRQQPRGPRRKSDGGGEQGERRMSLNTPLTELLGCRYPVVQTAMGWVADARLVAATTNAGGFGFLAAAPMTDRKSTRLNSSH